ncbi:MAG: hypothetical protein LBS83_02230 [Holosporales bacterium]|jgi:hypothetical protein|nr:hypothetical protein [Holosporales bacterium]
MQSEFFSDSAGLEGDESEGSTANRYSLVYSKHILRPKKNADLIAANP